MAAPSVPTGQVAFFTKADYSGDKHSYNIGDDKNLYPGSLNDSFNSAVVAYDTKVLAWQHANSSGVYKELEGENPSLSALGGLSRFKVIGNDVRVIAFKFTDETGGSARQYSLKLNAADVGEKILYSNEDDEFKLVGTIGETGPPVTTAIYLRNEHTGQYLSVGSVFFQWNAKTKQVDIVSNENFPKQLKEERTGPSKFVLTLISNKPSE
ncbi:abundant perithecial protein [Truncatella angustata]|uniref:Abundant perithecial protein n=1 Tax=Truncatella angustata TaxID=152316 RepID=A0A9P8UJB5_9PEZI|nr:abundant perithecial protein [Truncatella angustata]KAH6653083.1 abundant perithecial protein [Truncatella angustata]